MRQTSEGFNKAQSGGNKKVSEKYKIERSTKTMKTMSKVTTG